MGIKKQISVLSIQQDKEIQISISGVFYTRLNKLMGDFTTGKSVKEIGEALVLIKSGKTEKDHFAFNLETLMILVKGVESTFEKAGFTDTNDVELDVEDYKEDTNMDVTPD